MRKFREYKAVAGVNFKRGVWVSYLVSGICVLAMLADVIVDKLIPSQKGDVSVAAGNMLYLIPLLTPVFIASRNYVRLMNIGVKKKQYFYGCLINYVIFAAMVALMGVIDTYAVAPAILSYVDYEHLYSLVTVFGWDSNPLTAFFSPFFFILLLESVVHTLTFIQTKWYGIAADLLIVVIVSVFIPIPALRQALTLFFGVVIFSAPAVQIPVCAALSALIYATNLFYLKRRA